MSHAYTEDQLVEQPAIGLFAELGWSTVSALDEAFGVTGTLSRETKGDVVLVARLRAALERLNPALPLEVITSAIDELTRDRSAMSLAAANREVYLLLKAGGDSASAYATLAAAKEAGAVTLNYGLFINSVISFIIVAFALFMLIKGMNSMKRDAEAATPPTKECPHCFSAILIKATRCPSCTSTLS